MKLNLKGDWTLITGATSGIGYEMARILAAKGDSLVLVSRDEEGLCRIARELNEQSDIIIMPVDLGVTGSAKVLFDECERLKLDVSVLVNNAGFGKFGDITTMSSEEVESMLTLNMVTLTTLCKLFGNRMKERSKGYILNVSSMAAFQAIPYLSAYAASKTYVQHFTFALREEMKVFGVSVSCLFPGPTDTNFFEVAFQNNDAELFKKQPIMNPREVAKEALEGLFKKKRAIVPGHFNKVVYGGATLVHPSIVAKVIRRYSRN
jgi:short-subunit dehydrogenase